MLEVSERDAEEREADRAKQAQEELGDAIELGFRLPDGTECMKTFRHGHSVDYVKAVICTENEITASVELQCRGKRLLEPLSISDCNSIEPGCLNIIDVKVIV